MESVSMIPELADYLRACDAARNAALERRLQDLIDLGVPVERIVIRTQMGPHGWIYSVHVKSDSELLLDWLSENH